MQASPSDDLRVPSLPRSHPDVGCVRCSQAVVAVLEASLTIRYGMQDRVTVAAAESLSASDPRLVHFPGRQSSDAIAVS
jgi:hypothetical protein